jgi:hypothetical protein
MKIQIDPNLVGKALYSFLIANKDALIAQKKALPKYSDAVNYGSSFFVNKDGQIVKTEVGNIAPDASSVHARFVGNAAWWCDSQMDVLTDDSWSKTIKEGKGKIHLHDHIYRMDAQVGDVTKIYTQDVNLNELGLNKPGFTQCLVYESDVKKDYNLFVFNQYKAGKVNQHSIGLLYVKIELAINDADYEKEIDFWNKYIDKVINRDMVEEKGYFWIVTEIKLLECSAVLFGSNELTPTLDVKGGTEFQPLKALKSSRLHPLRLSTWTKQYLKQNSFN